LKFDIEKRYKIKDNDTLLHKTIILNFAEQHILISFLSYLLSKYLGNPAAVVYALGL
jgi:hypothetical protein